MLGWDSACATSSGTNGASMPSRFQTMKCAASELFTTSTAWMLLRVFLADALEHALGAGALDLHGDAGIFRLERLGDLLGDRQVDRGVPGDLAFLLRRLDQFRRDRGRRRRGAPHPGGRANAPARRAVEPCRTSRLENVGFVVMASPVITRCRIFRSSAQHAASFRRQMQPHRRALRDILGRREATTRSCVPSASATI